MSAVIQPPRPSRTYQNGIGKPVVARRFDGVLQAYQWSVVFPPCNSFGNHIVAPERNLVAKAEAWCWDMNRQRPAIASKKGGEA